MNKKVSMVCHSNCFLVGCVLLLFLLLLFFLGGGGGGGGEKEQDSMVGHLNCFLVGWFFGCNWPLLSKACLALSNPENIFF